MDVGVESMKEFPINHIMRFELMKMLLFNRSKSSAFVTFSFSPLLGEFKFFGY